MRKTAWIWALGCLVWVFSAAMHAQRHEWGNAGISGLLAGMFFAAWVFFRQQRK